MWFFLFFLHFSFRVDLICSKCDKRLANIDELCYCPSSNTNCHHSNGWVDLLLVGVGKVFIHPSPANSMSCFFNIFTKKKTYIRQFSKLDNIYVKNQDIASSKRGESDVLDKFFGKTFEF